MPGKVFLDSNIVLYAVGDDEMKRAVANDILATAPVISAQVLAETAAVLHRKFKLGYADVVRIVETVASRATLVAVTPSTVRSALQLGIRYGFSYYDCQILASALECGLPHAVFRRLAPRTNDR